MFADEGDLIEAIRPWVEKAESDLWFAALALKHQGTRRGNDGIYFHAQQCAEKYLKALLTWQGLVFPRTHDLEELIARLPEHNQPALTIE